MNKLSFFGLIAILFLVVSCQVAVPMNQDYLQKPSKVGVFVTVSEPQKYREGSQGLLDLAVTSGDKYKPLLEHVGKKMDPKAQLISIYTEVLRSRGKEVVIIDEIFDAKTATKFKGEKAEGKKYNTYDLSYLKQKYNVDDVVFVNMSWGVIISYYSMVETGRAGYVYLTNKVVDLNDQSLHFSNDNVQSIPIKGKWNTPPNYENAAGQIRQAVDKALETERNIFK